MPRFLTSTTFTAAMWLTLVCASDRDLAAVTSTPQITQVRVGFDGQYKVGYWVPVVVTLTGGADDVRGQLQLTARDGDGVLTTFSSGDLGEVDLPAAATSSFVRYVKFGRTGGGLSVKFVAEEETLAEVSLSASEIGRPKLSTSRLFVSIGGDIGIAEALRYQRQESDRSSTIVTARIEDVSDVPDRWFGYEGVDLMIVTTSDLEQFNQWSLAQKQALVSWVKLGGKLVFCVGSQGQHVLGESGDPFEELAPGEFVEVASLSAAAGLESLAGATRQLDGKLQMTALDKVRGQVASAERIGSDERASTVRFPLGFGQVTFVAVDLDQPPCASWSGRKSLVARILFPDRGRNETREGKSASGRAAHVGYSDISGQLRAALDQFDGVQLIWFSGIAGILVLYILLIGPADYFLLKKVFKRMQWTWVSFPLIVLSFCGLAVLLARTFRTPDLQVNQVEVIDIDTETSLARGTAWAHVYSPETATYDLSFAPTVPGDGETRDVLLSWHGLPGGGLGGMNTNVANSLFEQPYTITGQSGADAFQTSFTSMPVQVASSKTLAVRWSGTTTIDNAGQLRADVRDGSLRGRVTNPLQVELRQCVVFYDNWAYRLDKPSLKPGETVDVASQMIERTLDGYISRRKIIDTKDVPETWDRTSNDVPRIMELMMFFTAADGQSYTGLTHRYQAFNDLSDQLRMKRAVLTGYAKKRSGQLRQNGEPLIDEDDQNSWTFFRIVIPVSGQ